MPTWSFDTETDEFKDIPLYFIQEGKDGPIKIGRGTPLTRLATLQTGNPKRLQLLGHLEDAGHEEAFWHEAFRTIRIRGEWFKPTGHLLAAIRCALAGEDWADEAPAPEGVDPLRFKDEMIEGLIWYRDQLWMGAPEAEAALRAVSIAITESLAPDSEDAEWRDSDV